MYMKFANALRKRVEGMERVGGITTLAVDLI
jgi:hypothetical protein